MNVSQLTVLAQPTAVIAATTSWEAYPETWPRLLDELWSERLGLERVGPRWEIYGHFNGPGDEEVEIYYLVR